MNDETKGIGKLAGALAKAQGQLHGAKKDANNPHLRNKYADLQSCWDACREPLAKNEIAVIQSTEVMDDKMILRTLLVHSSGESISGVIPLVYGEAKGLNPMQAMGSAITYARRYGLCALVGIAPEDDDGATAGGNQQTPAAGINGEALAKNTFSKVAAGGVEAMRRVYRTLNVQQRRAVDPHLDQYKEIAEKADEAALANFPKQPAAYHPQDTTAEYVTGAQLKRLNAMVGEQGLNREHIKLALKANQGIDSTKDILKSDYESICEDLASLAAFGATLAPQAPAPKLPKIPDELTDTFTALIDEVKAGRKDEAREVLDGLDDEKQAILRPHVERALGE